MSPEPDAIVARIDISNLDPELQMDTQDIIAIAERNQSDYENEKLNVEILPNASVKPLNLFMGI